MINTQKIVLNIGTLPLPIGGVTVHLQRLLVELEKSDIYKRTLFYDYKRESKIAGLRKFLKSDIVHLHLSNKILRLFIILVCVLLGKKGIITFHGKYDFCNLFDRFSLKLSSLSLVLNESTLAAAIKNVNKKSKVILASAFIPPTGKQQELSEITKNELLPFKETFAKIACTNAHSYVLDNDKKDLYGIDFLLEIFAELSNFGLIVADPSGDLKIRYSNYLNKKNILFISRPEPFIELLKMSTVFIRATTTDGDSLSVKEALYYNIKVLASDCVGRPSGTLLFKTHSKRSLENNLRTIDKVTGNQNSKIVNGAKQIIECYNTL